jgi:hypothetical protein
MEAPERFRPKISADSPGIFRMIRNILAGIRNIYVSAGEYRRPFPLPVGINRPLSVSFLSKYHALR